MTMAGVAVQYTPTRDLNLERLMEEVSIELLDVRYFHLTHGRPATYNKGCRGHLCNYNARTRKREARREAMMARLPDGVVPDHRSRQEQYWDSVMAYVIEVMDDIREELAERKNLLRDTVDSILAASGIESEEPT